MKKFLLTLIFVVTFFTVLTISASAVTNDTVKVGLRYGSSALSSANLENSAGRGYSFGYYNSAREFTELGTTGQTTITMSVSSAYHVQLTTAFASFSDALAVASAYSGGYPAYLSGVFYVRIGSYSTSSEASQAADSLGVSATVEQSGSTGVLIAVTGTSTTLFEFDCLGLYNLGVLPNGEGSQAVTWFKGYRYYGGFEYARITGGNLNVLNVVNLEDYVKGVIPYEMSGDWPAEALKAQAVCARTYACGQTKHLKTYGFDVCNTTDCQVYYGVGSATATSNAAVEDTAGQQIFYNGSSIGLNAVYFSSDGGATENVENVWGEPYAYLIGKKDPYEATISIPNYSYTVTYTWAQLTWILQNSGYSIGTVCDAYVSQYTDMGNVYKVTFTDTAGRTLTVKGEKCRTAFYSSTYSKSVRSMRYTISGGSGAAAVSDGGCYVNNSSNRLDSVSGTYVISGSGTVSAYTGTSPYVITSSGTAQMSGGTSSSNSTASADGITITGTGSGHNVGMSQYGAYAMAKQGLSYTDILNFYYTNVTIG